MSRLRDVYLSEVMPVLMSKHGYQNPMQVPRLQKVVCNVGLGEAIQDPKAVETAGRDLAAITGQHAVVTRAKKSIAAFKLRKGMPIGLKVTLRGERMYDFLDRLINVALPRTREFRGVPRDSFDGWGNYTLAVKEQAIFPEIDYDKVDRMRGFSITIVTSACTDPEARDLLELLGMPFSRS